MGFRIRANDGALSRPGRSSIGGRIFGSLFFLVFLGMGLFATVLVARSMLAEVATYSWDEAKCTITGNSVEDLGGESPYVPRVQYTYIADGHQREGSRIQLSTQTYSSFSDAQQVASRYPNGTKATCLVNPEDADSAVLEHSSPFLGFIILIPLIFVAVGGGGIYFTWRDSSKKRSNQVEARPSSLANKTNKASPALIMGIMGGIFFLVGSITFIFLFVIPMFELYAAKSWNETPCTVISSEVRSHSSDDGTTYSVEILFEYRVEGRPFRSDRYRFSNWSSSGHSAKQEVVDQHPPGSTTVCYVDNLDPSQAVLDRDFHLAYLVGLFPLIFAVVGAGLLFFGLKNKLGQKQSEFTTSVIQSGVPFPSSNQVTVASGPLTLEPSTGPIAKLVGVIFFCLFWNGLISVFLWNLVSEWQSGHRQWGLALFLTPFVLVGLALVIGVGYSFLAVFNPRPQMTLATSRLHLGSQVQLDWQFSGRSGRIRRLTIKLEGQEEATYRRGTNSHTDTQVFHRAVLVDTEMGMEIQRGTRQLELPSDSMHSFSSNNNKIVWQLTLEGDISNWPDVSESFTITVLPHQGGGSFV